MWAILSAIILVGAANRSGGMYSFSGDIEISERILHDAHAALNSFLSKIPSLRENVLIPATANLFASSEHAGNLYLLTEGSLAWCRDDEILFMLEPGDFAGVEEGLGEPVGRYASEFAVRCDRYPMSAVTRALSESAETAVAWAHYLRIRSTLMGSCLIQALRGEKQLTPNIKSYKVGETVITQGTRGEEVFTLINGHAEVLVDGVRVGEILSDEIFGALAALTDLPRTATVVTTKESMILSIAREKFLELIESRPATVLKMVQDMARTIVDLNKRVVEKSKIFR